jgi:hypothetical protein
MDKFGTEDESEDGEHMGCSAKDIGNKCSADEDLFTEL